MILVSGCLIGINCKYSGGNNYDERIFNLVKEGKAIPVCPEQLGGLSTPRFASEINDEKVKVTTYGYGHGVGMSQYGANEMAKRGYSYIQILKHYYTGVVIK